MKMITAIIKPFKVEDIRDSLSALGVQGVTVSDVKGFGRQRGHSAMYRGAEYDISFIPKAKIEVVVEDDVVSDAISAISNAAHTGSMGDGKIFVSSLDNMLPINPADQ